MNRSARSLPLMLLLSAGTVFGTECEDVAALSLPGGVITAAKALPEQEVRAGSSQEPLPAHCRVDAVLRPTAQSAIEMALWLPVQWNGRFLAVGNGGWAGTLSVDAMERGLKSGYAVASNDTGHKGASAAFVLESPEKLVDFGHRAMHEMTLASKRLIETYYGEQPAFSYFEGCSTGGRQGLMEAQRYPEDFDAIIAGAPVNNMFSLTAAQMQSFTSILADRSLHLPENKIRLLHRAVLAACEVDDGVEDGFLNDPLACGFDPEALRCEASTDEMCLTPAQVESVRRAYSPLVTGSGSEVYPGHAKGFELGWRMPPEGTRPPALHADTFQYIVHRSPEWDWRSFDLDSDFDRAIALAGDVHAIDPDLRAFKARGGKLLIYHGWNDPGPSPLNTLDYYDAVLETLGPDQDDWLRVFMMPGMGHCRGGVGPDQADFLGAMEAWVEAGSAPERITSARIRDGRVDMTRPLCPYPEVPRWTGEGSAEDAANYQCVAE